MAEISEALQKRVSDLGIEVVDVRLERVTVFHTGNF